MDKQLVRFEDLDMIGYQAAWDYQESLLQENVQIKSVLATQKRIETEAIAENAQTIVAGKSCIAGINRSTTHHLLFCEHPPVYTLGKSGHMENILISGEEMERRGIQFYKANRGGDITFHGFGQIVGYPIIDLERFYTDIGKYLRALEEVIILALADYSITGKRSRGETGVWIDPGVPGQERKICAMGVRCSRWITMHGFALNVNTDLSYFDHIIPCGIQNKKVTSIEKELGYPVDMEEVKEKIKRNFEKVFDVVLAEG